MKWMIASDLHGSAFYTRQLMNAYEREQADRLLLLGDILNHGPRNGLPEEYDPMAVAAMLNAKKEDILCVRGNCDSEVDQMVLEFPIMADYIMLEINGLTIYATHGHKHNEKDPLPLHNHEIMLNGHFHVPACSDHEDWIYMNPGSVSLPKDGSHNSYMMLEDRTFTWYDIETNEVFGEVTVK